MKIVSNEQNLQYKQINMSSHRLFKALILYRGLGEDVDQYANTVAGTHNTLAKDAFVASTPIEVDHHAPFSVRSGKAMLRQHKAFVQSL